MLYPAYIIDLIDTSSIVHYQLSMYESIDCGIIMAQVHVHVGKKLNSKKLQKTVLCGIEYILIKQNYQQKASN